MERLNEILYELVRKKGTNKKVAQPLGITPQVLGKYIKGRKLPVSLITKWKEVYGDDLLKLANSEKEPNVSRETNSGEPVKVMPLDVWHRLERNFNNFEKNSELFEKVLVKEDSEKSQLLEIIRNLTSGEVHPHKMK